MRACGSGSGCPGCTTCTRTSCRPGWRSRCARSSTRPGRSWGDRGRSATAAPTTSWSRRSAPSAYAASPPSPTPTGPAWPSGSTTGPPTSPGGCRVRCGARRSTRSPTRRRTPPGGWPRAPRSGRCTCRSAASTCATRCSTRRGGCWPRRARPSCCTRAPGRCRPSTPGPARSPSCCAATRRLCLVLAHMGAPEYAEFLDLAESHERVHLDTTMVFTDFFDQLGAAYPPSLLPRLGLLRDKVLLRLGLPEHPARLRAPARRARAARAR